VCVRGYFRAWMEVDQSSVAVRPAEGPGMDFIAFKFVDDVYLQQIEKVMADHFFYQAEDGIRDKLVTGVQTCALPI